MTGAELKAIRKKFGLDRRLFAMRVIGYTGSDRNITMRMEQMERRDLIPLHIARLVWLVEKRFDMTDSVPDWPTALQLVEESDA